MTNAPFSETSLAFALSRKAYHQVLCLGHRAERFFPLYWFAKGCKKAVERPQPESANIFQECLDNRPLAWYYYELLCKVISLQSKFWKDLRGRQEKPQA